MTQCTELNTLLDLDILPENELNPSQLHIIRQKLGYTNKNIHNCNNNIFPKYNISTFHPTNDRITTPTFFLNTNVLNDTAIINHDNDTLSSESNLNTLDPKLSNFTRECQDKNDNFGTFPVVTQMPQISENNLVNGVYIDNNNKVLVEQEGNIEDPFPSVHIVPKNDKLIRIYKHHFELESKLKTKNNKWKCPKCDKLYKSKVSFYFFMYIQRVYIFSFFFSRKI